MPLSESHAPGEVALLHTLETIYYRNKAKEECVCCLSSAPSCLEVKEFADIEPEVPGLILCHKPEASCLLSNEISSYSLMALFFCFFCLFGFFFMSRLDQSKKCSVHCTVLWFCRYCCMSVHICEVLECIIFVMRTIFFFFFLNSDI